MSISRFARGFAVLACAITAAACQSPVREFYGIAEDVAYGACECWEERSFESEAACRAMLDLPNEAQIACTEEVYERYSGSVEPTYDCLLGVARDFQSCANRIAMCDAEAFSACGSAFGTAVGDCPPLPPGPAADFQACAD